jgi:hypothetical protein
MPNQTLRFGKLEQPIFQDLVRCSVWGHCVSLISLRFLGYVEHWNFVGNPCVILLDRATCLHLRLNIKYISSTWACIMLILTTSFLFDFMWVATFDLAFTFTFRRLWLGVLHTVWSIFTFDLQVTSYLDSIVIDT